MSEKYADASRFEVPGWSQLAPSWCFCASTCWILQCNVLKKQQQQHNIKGKLGKLTLDQTGTVLFSLQCIFH